LHGTNLGAVDLRATFPGAIDDHSESGWSAAADVFVGSDGVCERRRTGGGGSASSGGGSRIGDRGTRARERDGKRNGARQGIDGGAGGGFTAAGTRGSGQAGERHGSGGESGNQHQTAAFGAGRSGEIVVPCRNAGGRGKWVGGARFFAKYKRIDSDGRCGICAAAHRMLAGGTPTASDLRGNRRVLERCGHLGI